MGSRIPLGRFDAIEIDMKIPFFNLQETRKVKQDEAEIKDAINSILDLATLSHDNGKEIKEILLSRSVYYELIGTPCYNPKNETIFNYKIKVIPDIAVVWKKEGKKKK